MDTIPAVTSVVGAVVAVATLVNAVRQYRRKVHLDIFREYVERYNRIVTPDMYQRWHEALTGNREEWAAVTPTMLQYLNLVWEEYVLSRNGVIPRRLWRLWRPEIELVLASEFAKATMDAHGFHFPNELTCA